MVSLRMTNGVVPSVSSPPPADEQTTAGHQQPLEVNGLYCSIEVRILVLDDDLSVGRVMQAALTPSDFKVDAVFEASEMEAVLHSQPPYHVIILDYVIPGLETDQILEWIREYQPEASIIVVTAYPSMDWCAELSAGAHL